MKCTSQPTSTQRYHTLTVAEIIEALRTMPPDAVVQFKDGGRLEADLWDNWKDVELVCGPHIRPVVKTKWM